MPEIVNAQHLTLDYFSSGNLFQDRHRSALLCTCRTKLSIRHFISHPAIYCRFQNLFFTLQFIAASKIYFLPCNLIPLQQNISFTAILQYLSTQRMKSQSFNRQFDDYPTVQISTTPTCHRAPIFFYLCTSRYI